MRTQRTTVRSSEGHARDVTRVRRGTRVSPLSAFGAFATRSFFAMTVRTKVAIVLVVLNSRRLEAKITASVARDAKRDRHSAENGP